MFVFNFLIFALILLVAVALLFFRKWKISGFLFVVVIFLNNYWEICPINVYSEENIVKGDTFRIVTYNIYPNTDSTHLVEWQKQMFEEIKRLNPDILCLQEFNVRKLPLLEDELCKFYSYSPDKKKQRKKLRGKLYSHYELTDIRTYKPLSVLDSLDYSESFRKSIKVHNRRQPFYSAVVHLPSGDSVVVYSCHLQSNGYSTLRRQMKDKSWFVGIPEYYSAIREAEKIRLWEASNLRTYIDSLYPSRNIVVAGDFNDFSASETVKTAMGNNLQDVWWNYGTGLGITYSDFHLNLRLDHILVNDQTRVIYINVEDCRLSDHRPLVVDCALSR